MDLDTTSLSTRVSIQKYDDALVVSLHGEHDVSSAPLVRERLADARGASGRIVVDLSAANFIDSTIAGTHDHVAVVRLERWLRARGFDDEADRVA
jgi:hypothetical protein